MDYHFDFWPIWERRDLILEGLVTTIVLSLAALALAAVLGTVVGTLGTAHSRALRTLSALYVECMRNVPLLVHMYFWYMALAFLKLPAFTCAMFGLSLYSGAYVAEVVRAGLGSIPAGQTLAGLAVGLTPLQTLRYIVFPQALRVIAPSLASLLSQLIKDSSLASVLAVAELTYQASAIEGQTFRTFEVYIVISLLYLLLVTVLSQTIAWFAGEGVEARLSDA
ncbi:MAG TPA: amino acid ABC transporter permease [Pseudolabrys sp.]|nr:amino acid ABC transporter permease [Pseudolabrys sp.]